MRNWWLLTIDDDDDDEQKYNYREDLVRYLGIRWGEWWMDVSGGWME